MYSVNHSSRTIRSDAMSCRRFCFNEQSFPTIPAARHELLFCNIRHQHSRLIDYSDTALKYIFLLVPTLNCHNKLCGLSGAGRPLMVVADANYVTYDHKD